MPQIELYRPFVNKRERIPCLDLTLLYLAQHQSFTGESRSWSRGIELGPRPRMEFHFTSKLHNQANSEPKCLSLWLTWHHSVTPHPSHPSPWCSLSELRVISPSEMRLGLQRPHLAPAPTVRQVGKLELAAVTWALAWPWLLSVRWSVVCCLRLGHFDAYTHPRRYHKLWSRLQKCRQSKE